MRQEKVKHVIRKEISGIWRRLRTCVRRICSFMLCAALIAGGMPETAFTAFAADDTREYIYELTGEELIKAIRHAVAEENTLNVPLDFKGEYSDEYSELFDADGTLYEIKNYASASDASREKDLILRIFVRIENDIAIDDDYEVNGSEQILFLLINKTKEEVTANICLDDLETGNITVVPACDIPVDRTDADIVLDISDDAGISGSKIITDSEVVVFDEGGNVTDAEIGEDVESQEKAGKDDASSDEEADAEGDSPSGKDNSYTGNEDITEDDHVGREESARDEDSDEGGVTDKGDISDEDSTGKDHHDKADNPDKNDSANDDTADKGASGKSDSAGRSASVSMHKNNFLTASLATSSDARKEKASPSDANKIIEGDLCEPVRIGSRGAVAYATTLRDLGIDYGIQLLDLVGDGVYLDGTETGNDETGDGTSGKPVKTFGKAKELAESQNQTNIIVTGTVTIKDNEEWDGTVNNNTTNLTINRAENFADGPLVKLDGGNLTLSNITFDGQEISTKTSLIVVENENSTLTVTDGTIIRNNINTSQYLNGYYQGAICVKGGELKMTGGSIENNNASFFAGGIALLGYAESKMNITGGTINNNTVSSSTGSGGGIYLIGNSTLYMDGGTVSYNTAGGYGGGIYVGQGAVAVINSGEISYNSQTKGINYGGGGIYVNGEEQFGGSKCKAGTLYLYNAEIAYNKTTNTASGNSGYHATISCCDTGDITIHLTKGSVIHDNNDEKTIMVYRNGTSENFFLSPIMLGGAPYNWEYLNGELLDLNNLVWDKTGWLRAVTKVSLNNNTVSGLDRVKTKIIYNEAAVLGSAIGSNGHIIIGQNDGDVVIKVKKVWDDQINPEIMPESIVVGVYATDVEGNTVRVGNLTLTAKNNWESETAEGVLPKYDSDGNEYIYTVEEDDSQYAWIGIVEGGEKQNSGHDYETDTDKTAEYEFTVTNKIVEPTITKEIVEDDYKRKEENATHMHEGEDTGGDGWGSWDDADNNQEVTYRLTLEHIKDVHDMTVHDYLEDGLKLEPETLEIKLYADFEDKEGRLLKQWESNGSSDYEYYITQGECSDKDAPAGWMDGCTFEVHFAEWLFDAELNPVEDEKGEALNREAYVVITYNALTDTHAEDYFDEGHEYEDIILNDAYLTGTFALSTLSFRTRPVMTETDLFGFGVYKYAVVNGIETALENAQFILERNGQYAIFDMEGDKDFIVSGWTDDRESEKALLTSGEDGMIRINGLDDDTYTLIEINAPEGYSIKDESITVVIDEDGNITVDGNTGSKEMVTGHVVNIENTSKPNDSTYNPPTHHTGGGGGGSSRGGSGAGGPSIYDSDFYGEDNLWNLLPMPQTGQGEALLFGIMALMTSAIALIMLLLMKRKNKAN